MLLRLLATLVVMLALPASAEAMRTCSKTGTQVTVTASEPGEEMTIRRQLGGVNPLIINGTTCDDANISNVDKVTFTAGAQNQTVTIDYSNGFLTTGTASGGFNDFTDYFVDGFGDTTVVTKGSPFTGTIVVAGADGIDADIGFGEPDIFPTDIGLFWAQGSSLSETMTTAGGAGVGGPYTGAALLEGGGGQDHLTGGASATTLDGGSDDDTLVANAGADASGGPDDDLITGGSGDNTLSGGTGRDQVSGLGGNDTLAGDDGTDTLIGGAGNDAMDGGEGSDTASWGDVAGPVTAGLATGSATGAGADTLSGIETLEGSPAGDALAGGPGAETLLGGAGDDTLQDGGGADVFDGGPGTDSVSYAVTAGPVTVDLAAGSATEAAGGDALAGLERVTGSAFADHLLGTPAADLLAGGGGNDTLDPRGGPDTVAGAAGADTLLLRDAAADFADCGDGADTAVVDRSGDVVTGCETVQLPPDPPPPVPICVPAFDIPANGVDENCDGKDARLRPVAATVASTWKRSSRGATLSKLRASRLPAGGKAVLRCKGRGCPFKRKVVRGAGTVDLRKAVGRRRTFPDGAVLRVKLSAPFTLAKTFTYRIRANRIPRAVVRCAVAGSKKTRAC